MAGSRAGAQQSTSPNPEPLWKAYPLDDAASAGAGQGAGTTSTAAQPAASPARTSAPTPLSTTDQAGDGPPWALMVAAAAGGALFVVLLLTVQGRRARRRRDDPLVGAAEEWPWLAARTTDGREEFRVERLPTAQGSKTASVQQPAAAPFREPAANDVEPQRAVEPVANGTAAERVVDPERAAEPVANGTAAERVAEPERAVEPAPNGTASERAAEPSREPDFEVAEAGAVPRHRFDRESGLPNGRSAAARRGPICQVRWSAPGTCFYAVTADADGTEHRIAWSPPIEWGDPGPPDEDSRQARAALRVISKDLRDKGWRPMRAKGEDFDEQRWYARRFRFPAAEGEEAPQAVARAHGRA
jgi:hypothetical protein